jgi:hypothetical protein
MKRPLLFLLAAIVLVLTFGVQGALAFAGMELVSVSSGGVQGNDVSGTPSISADGRYIAFQSLATNLVIPATSGTQIFLRDRLTGVTTLASAGPGGAYGDSNSVDPSISGNGRYIGFESPATNLVSPASSGNQVFVRDTQAGTTELASVNSSGVQGNDDSFNASLSADGRYIAFQSPATNLVSPASSGNQIFVRDRQAGATTLVSVNAGGDPCDGYSSNPSISPDGRYVSFESWSTNLVSPPTTNSYSQIFVHDRQTGANWLASKGPGGSEGNANSLYSSISAGGRYVAFFTDATNLVSPATSDIQVFVYDRQSDAVTLVSVNTSGSEGNNRSLYPSISADGRYIAFYSWATDLVSPPTSGVQAFVRDRQAGTTTLVSVNASGAQGNNYSAFPSISPNGNFVAFTSGATNLVSPPTSSDQIFVSGGPYVPPPPATLTINATAGANGSISPTGSVIVSSGASRTFTITANAGYQIADVRVDGRSAGAVSSYTFSNVTANHTISASFASSSIGSGTQPHGAGLPGAPASAPSPMMLPNIQVQSASLSASRVVPGTPVTITAILANRGTANGTTAVKIYVNGQEEASKGITVNSSSNIPLSFTVTRNEPGTYEVYAGGVSAGSFTVESADSSTILFISMAMIFIALVVGMLFLLRRKQPA